MVFLASPELLIPLVKNEKAHVSIGESLLHPQWQQLSDSCRALSADLLTTKTLRRSPCAWAPEGQAVLYQEGFQGSLNTLGSQVGEILRFARVRFKQTYIYMFFLRPVLPEAMQLSGF